MNKIEKTPDGNLTVELETGEKFSGDPLEVTQKMADAHVATKRWGAGFKAEVETLKQQQVTPPAVTTPANPNDAQLQSYLLDQHAQALGYKSGAEYKADLTRVRAQTDEMRNKAVAADFMQMAPDFPNTPEAIEALSKKIDEMHWDYTPQSLLATHSLLVRENSSDPKKGYKPLSESEITATWEQNLRQSNRPTYPPSVRGGNPESTNPGFDPWKGSLNDLRAEAIRQELQK